MCECAHTRVCVCMCECAHTRMCVCVFIISDILNGPILNYFFHENFIISLYGITNVENQRD